MLGSEGYFSSGVASMCHHCGRDGCSKTLRTHSIYTVPEETRYSLLQPQLEINPSHPTIMKPNELRNSNPRLAELTAKQECGTCGQVLDQRSQGLESCSGSAKILGGFREVGQILESWDPTSPHSSHSPFRTTRTSSAKDTTPVTTIVCDIHKVNGLNGDVTTSNTYPDSLPPPIIDGLATTVLAETMSTAIPMPVPELPCAFNTK
ncbi:uncharacterized protein [Procambarus clarkii]|uniref:uncharacterized protein isoform X2 n=1 Tax=Procambarus clarkii TaxID=6728 RepID=UPI003741F36D